MAAGSSKQKAIEVIEKLPADGTPEDAIEMPGEACHCMELSE